MKLTFDADTHTYRLNGRVVPGVTDTIRAVCGSGWDAPLWYRERGTILHAAAPLIAAGKLDWWSWESQLRDALSSADVKSILGRARAIGTFLTESGLSPMFFEHQMASPTLQLAGTADLVALDSEKNAVIVDWKGSLDPRVELQLGFYSLLWTATGEKPCVRVVAVKLNDDGSYKLYIGTRKPRRDNAHFDLTKAENVARHVRSVLAWMQEKNLTGGGR